MVIFRSKVSTTKNGRQWGLRRGAAAVAVGVVLAATAGVPASHAATGLSAAASTAPSVQGSLTLGLGDVLDGLLGSPTAPRPSPSAGSDEATPSRPPSHGSSPEPSEPSDPEPSDPEPGDPEPTAPPTSTPRTSTPPPSGTPSAKPAPPAAPQVPGTPPAATAPGAPAPGGSAGSAPTGKAPGQPAPGSGSADPAAEPGAAVPAEGSGTSTQASASTPATSHPSPTGSNTAESNAAGATMAPAKGHSGNSSLEATSVVKPAGLSPLVGWGIGLVVFSLGAGVAVVRMRRS